jgi:CCGSCS motif protein
MFKLIKAIKENHMKKASNEVKNSNDDPGRADVDKQTKSKKHGSEGVCCGGCGGQ